MVEIDYGRILQKGWRLLTLASIFGILLGIGSGLLIEPFYIVRYLIQIGHINEKPILTIEDAAVQIQGLAPQAVESLKLQRAEGKSEWRLRVEKEPPRFVRFGIWAASPDLAESLGRRLAELIAQEHQKRIDSERKKFEDHTREVRRLQSAMIVRTRGIIKEIEAIEKRMGNILSGKGSLSPEEIRLLLDLRGVEINLMNSELSLLRTMEGLPVFRFEATQVRPMDSPPIVDRGIGTKARAILGGMTGIFLGAFFLIARAMRDSGERAS